MSNNAMHQNRSEIMKEQVKLVKLEKEITTMLKKINQNLNVLKVEELQLKSNVIQKNIQMKQSYAGEDGIKPCTSTTTAAAYFPDNAEEINKQNMDLELMIKKFEEEDDDSE